MMPSNSDDIFDGESFTSLLGTETIGRGDRLVVLRETDSTNEEAKRRAASGAEDGLLVFAEMQTKGKGRKGRSWTSPPGCNLAFSILLRPDIDPDDASMITIIAALSCVIAIRRISGEDALIKWPNDIVLNGRKLVGILTEMVPEKDRTGFVVVGMGINVNTPSFPSELKDIATSLLLESGQACSRTALAAECVNGFERLYREFLLEKSLAFTKQEYESLCVNLGKEVRVIDPKGSFNGTALEINDRGSLIVKRADGTETEVYAGEVSVRGMYGYI